MLAPNGLFKDASALAQVLTGISFVLCILWSFCVFPVLLTKLSPDLTLILLLICYLVPDLGSVSDFGSAYDSIPRCPPVDDSGYSCDTLNKLKCIHLWPDCCLTTSARKVLSP